MIRLSGLPMAIGSLPHKDAEAAIDLILKYLPKIPFWPQLPNIDKREGMVSQFMEMFPVPLRADGDIFFDEPDAYPSPEVRLEAFYEKVTNNDIGYFKISEKYSKGLYAFKKRLKDKPELLKNIEFIKCQITGPFTMGASVKDESGVPYLNDPVVMQAFIEGLKMKALWQIEFFKEFNKPMVMFIDEPYLTVFGSAYTPINRDDVVNGLIELSAGIKASGALTGVHCCGNTDWSMLTEVSGIDIINFDAYSFWDRFVLYADSVEEFLKRGGFICWGLVPTEEYSDSMTPDSLISKMEEGIEVLVRKGIGPDLLYKHMLLSPSCGLGSLDIGKSEKILKTLAEISKLIRKNP